MSSIETLLLFLMDTSNQTDPTMERSFAWWLMVSLNTFFVLAGQSVGTLLGKFYYDQGGNSKWTQALVLSAAFPILYFPLLLLPPSPSPSSNTKKTIPIYVVLGLLSAADNLMYAYGYLYLSVSVYSLVCATQVAFNAVFSYFINSENFTHLTLNSVVLLTFSSAILGLHSDPGSSSHTNFITGFVLTLIASATYSLVLSLMELTFDKVLKSQNFTVVLEMQIYTSMVAALATFAGLFASGEWRMLMEEMEGFGKGKVAYCMVLISTAVAWQVANVGVVGLVFEVSSLFSNVVSTLPIPLAPVLAVILFHDSVDGIKVVASLLALWGFVSYFYQHYIQYKLEKKPAVATEDGVQVSTVL